MDALQYKLARTMLGLTVIETANLCDVSHETIRRIEAGDTTLKGKTIAKVRAAFEKAGVEFIEENGGDPGVRFKKRSKSVEEISTANRRARRNNFVHTSANGAQPRSRHGHDDKSCRRK